MHLNGHIRHLPEKIDSKMYILPAQFVDQLAKPAKPQIESSIGSTAAPKSLPKPTHLFVLNFIKHLIGARIGRIWQSSSCKTQTVLFILRC